MRRFQERCSIKVPTANNALVIRVRFRANATDYRPITWPVDHPYWCTGYNESRAGEYANIVAYVESEADVKRQWPEAEMIQVSEPEADHYMFTSRFQPPDWFLPNIGARGIPPLVHDDIELMTQRWEAVVSVLGGIRGNRLIYPDQSDN